MLEGNRGATAAQFTLTTSAPPAAGRSYSVKVATANGTEMAETDYAALPLSTVTFGPGEGTETVVVHVIGNTTKEASETVGPKLSKTQGVVIADTSVNGYIVNDD